MSSIKNKGTPKNWSSLGLWDWASSLQQTEFSRAFFDLYEILQLTTATVHCKNTSENDNLRSLFFYYGTRWNLLPKLFITDLHPSPLQSEVLGVIFSNISVCLSMCMWSLTLSCSGYFFDSFYPWSSTFCCIVCQFF